MKYKIVMAALFVFGWHIGTAQAATSSIMIDAKTGNVLYEDNADVRRYPASLTKLMTLYLTFNALENGTLKLDDQLKISHTAANRSPSRLGLTPGKTIDVRTAILATIVKSANDCATVLGEALAKDERSFARLMTETAHQLGMKKTTFKNASGLQHSEQKTTARDMAILGAALYHHYPQYYAWFAIDQFQYEGKTYSGHNTLLKDFAGADGMKTGFTAAAGYNIVTSAKRGNHRVIAVTMGHDHVKDRDKKVYAMMDKALANADSGQVIHIRTLKTAIDNVSPVQRRTQYAKVETLTPVNRSVKNNWAIQAGAYASYDTAKNQAESVRRKLASRFSGRGIHIEKFDKNKSAMYRAQVTGFSKIDAQKACNMLKKSGHPCMVTTIHKTSDYAQR